MKILDRTKNIIESKIKKYEKCFEDPELEFEVALDSIQSIILDLEKSAAAALTEMTIIKNQIEGMKGEQAKWLDNAKRAVGAGQDDLARRALLQKKSVSDELELCENYYEQTEENFNYFKKELISSKDKYNNLKSKLNLLKHNKLIAKAGVKTTDQADEGKLEREFEKLNEQHELSSSIEEEFNKLKEKLNVK